MKTLLNQVTTVLSNLNEKVNAIASDNKFQSSKRKFEGPPRIMNWQRDNSRRNFKSRTSNGRVVCYYCGKPGHSARMCWYGKPSRGATERNTEEMDKKRNMKSGPGLKRFTYAVAQKEDEVSN